MLLRKAVRVWTEEKRQVAAGYGAGWRDDSTPENKRAPSGAPSTQLQKAAYAATLRLYSLVRVSISMRSPVSQNAGTWTRWPVASLAGFNTLPDVSPRTAGSV